MNVPVYHPFNIENCINTAWWYVSITPELQEKEEEEQEEEHKEREEEQEEEQEIRNPRSSLRA